MSEVVILLMTYQIKYVPNKAVDLNLSVSKIIIGINESKTLTKYILCKCKSRFDGRKGNSDEW